MCASRISMPPRRALRVDEDGIETATARLIMELKSR
jgi:hypothetical protein